MLKLNVVYHGATGAAVVTAVGEVGAAIAGAGAAVEVAAEGSVTGMTPTDCTSSVDC